MSAVHALERLERFGQTHGDIELQHFATVLRSGPASESTFDYDQGIAIIRACPEVLRLRDSPRVQRLREIILALILHSNPPWKWLIPLGRGYLSQYLPPDAKQVFDSADLYGASDDPVLRSWWDNLAQEIRSASAESSLHVGRTGEDLTIAHESRILVEAGRPDLRPELVGFEDSTLGYDVDSFTITASGVAPKRIEVKTTEVQPLRFSFTKTQWAAAQRHTSNYFVHLWHLPSKQLIEINFVELSTAIPQDRGRGKWETAIISWS
jgi:hypothetical protein